MARGKKTAAPLKASTPSANGSNKGSNKKTAGVAMKKQNKQKVQTPAKSSKKPVKVVKQPVKVESEEEDEEEDEGVNEEDAGEEASETEDSDDADDEEDDEFEDQGSSSDDDSGDEEEEDVELTELEEKTRRFTVDREKEMQKMREDGSLSVASQLHVDDLSSDDEVGWATKGVRL